MRTIFSWLHSKYCFVTFSLRMILILPKYEALLKPDKDRAFTKCTHMGARVEQIVVLAERFELF